VKVAPKKKAGRQPILDGELVAAAIVELEGNISSVAKRFGVSRSAVQKMVAARPTLQSVLQDAREGLKDDAESALVAAVRGGEAWAVCFFLKTQGKDRGYVERSEVEQTTRARLLIEEEVVDAGGGGRHPGQDPAAPQAG
jgi:hypothetical protein